MKKHAGGFAPEDDATKTLPAVLPYPRRVAVIVNRGCGSTCEQFVLAARQSKKVTLYGTNTAGVLDYANLLFAPIGSCSDLSLHYATSRTKRLPQQPVAPMGIAPDVAIPETEMFPIELVRKTMITRTRAQ